MSIMHFDAMPAAASDTLVVNLDGAFIQDQTGFLEARAGIQSRADGTMWRRQGGSLIQIDSGTDWITPRTTFDPADYEIRMNYNGQGPDGGHPGIDVWLPMNFTRTWEWSCNRFCVEQADVTLDIRHATDGSKNVVSSLEDSAACMATNDQYTVNIEAT